MLELLKIKKQHLKTLIMSDEEIKNAVPITDPAIIQKYYEALGFKSLELTDAQLAKLGLDKDTYLKNGVKYRAVGEVIAGHFDGPTTIVNVRPPHTANGDLMDPNKVYNYVINYMSKNFDGVADLEIDENQGIDFTARLAPYVKGGMSILIKVAPLQKLMPSEAFHQNMIKVMEK